MTEKTLGESCLISPCFSSYTNLMWIHKSIIDKWSRKSFLFEEESCTCICDNQIEAEELTKKCSNGTHEMLQPLRINRDRG